MHGFGCGGYGMTDGACMMCATESETVRPYSFGANFTSYNELAAGDGLCSKCVELIEDRSSRQKSWIIEGRQANHIGTLRLDIYALPRQDHAIHHIPDDLAQDAGVYPDHVQTEPRQPNICTGARSQRDTR